MLFAPIESRRRRRELDRRGLGDDVVNRFVFAFDDGDDDDHEMRRMADAVSCAELHAVMDAQGRADVEFYSEFVRVVRARLLDLATAIVHALIAATADRVQVELLERPNVVLEADAVAQPPPRLGVSTLTAAPAAPPLALAG